MYDVYMGVDVGSVSTNFAVIDEDKKIIKTLYIRTKGNPINAIQGGLKKIQRGLRRYSIKGVGTTGSGRYLGGVILGADTIKNEITTHGIAALEYIPKARTIIEIGGQDSKLILLNRGVICDFAMNTVCAAGTGSFIDRQAERLGIKIENFGEMALNSKTDVRIAGRCAVFAESDMIHKQQMGHNEEDIANGLCEALARNYINNLGKGKKLKPPFVFQGGVSLNIGIVKAFERLLENEIHVPKHSNVMGAIGAAILAREKIKTKKQSSFKGFNIKDSKLDIKSFECNICANMCEVIKFYRDGKLISRWNDKCGRWTNMSTEKDTPNILLGGFIK